MRMKYFGMSYKCARSITSVILQTYPFTSTYFAGILGVCFFASDVVKPPVGCVFYISQAPLFS